MTIQRYGLEVSHDGLNICMNASDAGEFVRWEDVQLFFLERPHQTTIENAVTEIEDVIHGGHPEDFVDTQIVLNWLKDLVLYG